MSRNCFLLGIKVIIKMCVVEKMMNSAFRFLISESWNEHFKFVKQKNFLQNHL